MRLGGWEGGGEAMQRKQLVGDTGRFHAHADDGLSPDELNLSQIEEPVGLKLKASE